MDSNYGSYKTHPTNSTNESSLLDVSSTTYKTSSSGCSSGRALSSARTKEKKKEQVKKCIAELKSLVPWQQGGRIGTLNTLKHVIAHIKKIKEDERTGATVGTVDADKKGIVLGTNTDNLNFPFPQATADGEKPQFYKLFLSVKEKLVVNADPEILELLEYPENYWFRRNFLDFLAEEDVETAKNNLMLNVNIEDTEQHHIGNGNHGNNGSKVFFVRLRHYKSLNEGFSLSRPDRVSVFCVKSAVEKVKCMLPPDGAAICSDNKCIVLYLQPLTSPYMNHDILPEQHCFSTQHDVNCNYSFVDSTAVCLLGHLPQDMIGASIFDFFHSDDLPVLLGIYQQIVRGTEEVFKSVPYRLRTHNGYYVTVETEWFIWHDPWTNKRDLIYGRSKVIKGPDNFEVFSEVKGPPVKFGAQHVNIRKKIRSLLLQLTQKTSEKPLASSLLVDQVSGGSEETLPQVSADLTTSNSTPLSGLTTDSTDDSKGDEKFNEEGEVGREDRVSPATHFKLQPADASGPAGISITEEEKAIIYQRLNYAQNIRRFLVNCSAYSGTDSSDDQRASSSDHSVEQLPNTEDFADFQVPIPKLPSCASSTKALLSEQGHPDEGPIPCTVASTISTVADIDPAHIVMAITSNDQEITMAINQKEAAFNNKSPYQYTTLTETTLKLHNKLQERRYIQEMVQEKVGFLNTADNAKSICESVQKRISKKRKCSVDMSHNTANKHVCKGQMDGLFENSSLPLIPPFQLTGGNSHPVSSTVPLPPINIAVPVLAQEQSQTCTMQSGTLTMQEISGSNTQSGGEVTKFSMPINLPTMKDSGGISSSYAPVMTSYNPTLNANYNTSFATCYHSRYQSVSMTTSPRCSTATGYPISYGQSLAVANHSQALPMSGSLPPNTDPGCLQKTLQFQPLQFPIYHPQTGVRVMQSVFYPQVSPVMQQTTALLHTEQPEKSALAKEEMKRPDGSESSDGNIGENGTYETGSSMIFLLESSGGNSNDQYSDDVVEVKKISLPETPDWVLSCNYTKDVEVQYRMPVLDKDEVLAKDRKLLKRMTQSLSVIEQLEEQYAMIEKYSGISGIDEEADLLFELPDDTEYLGKLWGKQDEPPQTEQANIHTDTSGIGSETIQSGSPDEKVQFSDPTDEEYPMEESIPTENEANIEARPTSCATSPAQPASPSNNDMDSYTWNMAIEEPIEIIAAGSHSLEKTCKLLKRKPIDIDDELSAVSLETALSSRMVEGNITRKDTESDSSETGSSKNSSDLTPSDQRSSEEAGSSVKESDNFSSDRSSDNGSSFTSKKMKQHSTSKLNFSDLFVPLQVVFEFEKQPSWIKEADFSTKIQLEYTTSPAESEAKILREDKRRQQELSPQPELVVDQLTKLVQSLSKHVGEALDVGPLTPVCDEEVDALFNVGNDDEPASNDGQDDVKANAAAMALEKALEPRNNASSSSSEQEEITSKPPKKRGRFKKECVKKTYPNSSNNTVDEDGEHCMVPGGCEDSYGDESRVHASDDMQSERAEIPVDLPGSMDTSSSSSYCTFSKDCNSMRPSAAWSLDPSLLLQLHSPGCTTDVFPSTSTQNSITLPPASEQDSVMTPTEEVIDLNSQEKEMALELRRTLMGTLFSDDENILHDAP